MESYMDKRTMSIGILLMLGILVPIGIIGIICFLIGLCLIILGLNSPYKEKKNRKKEKRGK